MAGKQMSGRAWLLLLALSVLWGGSFFFAEVALEELPPLTVVLARVGLAALALLVAARMFGHALPRDGATLGAFLVMGLLNNAIPFGLIVWGQTAITSGLAAILNATTPLFAVLLAHVLTADERLTPNRLSGVVVGMVGVTTIVGPAALGELGAAFLAQLAVLTAACSYALAGIYGRRFRGRPPLVVAAGQTSASTLMLLPLVLMVDHPWTLPAPGAATLAALLGIALLCTALAYVLYFRILALAGATNLLLVTLLIPVTALLLGAGVLGEPVAGRQLAGMALIGAGLLIIDGRLLRRPGRAAVIPPGGRASAGPGSG